MIRSFNGKSPKIHPTAFVSEAAYVVGDVEIGPYCSVWPGAIIRANIYKIVLSEYVDIQDNCVVHSDGDAWYGPYTTLGHHVMCHATTVGANCLVGNGATINGGAIVGEFSIVGSGSVVLESKDIPPHSFVTGIPAEVRGPTTERHHQLARRTAEGYARNGQSFKAEGLGDVPKQFLMPEEWRPTPGPFPPREQRGA